MPIIDPTMANILKKAGAMKSSSSAPQQGIAQILDENGFSLEETVKSMQDIRDSTDNDGIKKGINETALKMHGVLKDQPTVAPAVTIVIRDAYGEAPAVNPIMLPRTLIESVQ